MLNPVLLHPALIDTFARLHRQELMDTAARIRLERQLGPRARRRFRVRAGWRLVQAGMRLALVDGPPPPTPVCLARAK
jgi:hypothetical protein